ncbi:MAG: leucyl aminopeptidase [Defluviicoccus sp.]|nr:leucyl aminopeptidase [Defluviicoccus sp.]MDE0274999.1 leucyl aminopeptidase [Defluviicoccus sp.]
MKISFAAPRLPRSGALALGVHDGGDLAATATEVDAAAGGALSRAVGSSRFSGKSNQTLILNAPAGVAASRVVLVGLGKAADFDARAAQSMGGTIVSTLEKSGDSAVTIAVDATDGAPVSPAVMAANVGFGALLRGYRFDKYRTKEKPDDKPSLNRITVATQVHARARGEFRPLAEVAEGVFLTRDLVSEPANVIFPASLAERAKSLTELGVTVEILDEKRMAKLGMGALLGVAQGSANAPKLVTMRWNGAPRAKDKRPIAFVGKGVTFDTGGISIKPSGGMEDMKWDMGGAGVVIGLMRALAGRKARVNAVGMIGLVENMPSATAQRPGDVVTSMSGQTVEVINTDAEGRLVLCDAFWYCQEKYSPRAIVDLATLTGAIIVSLGHENAGLFANDDTLADRLIAAGGAVGESVWRMPLGDAYDRQIDSDIADMKNVGGRDAGSITAAQFLQRFIKEGTPWAHLDIAGVTWSKKSSATVPKGGTGFGVRLLDRLVRDHYEG